MTTNLNSPSRDRKGEKHRQTPVLLPLLAIFSIALLGLAGFVIATPAEAALVPIPPLELPVGGPGGATISGATPSHATSPDWIVAGRPDSRTTSLAAQAGATPVASGMGIYRITRQRARAFAGALDRSGRLIYAEPDVKARASSYPDDLYADSEWWLSRIVNPTDTTPPVVNEFSPELGLLEESVDPLHPDLTTARLAGAVSFGPARDWHGTAVAAIAGSPGEMLGIRGVWPGMKMRLIPMGTTCTSATDAVVKAVRAKVTVLNMSYGFPEDSCFSHYVATEFAVKAGILPVAAAGNTNVDGNTPMRPATDPHVISVSAVDGKGSVAPFATRNAGVDITAPGVDILAPNVSSVVGAAGTDVARGWANLSGTSFSTPMVAAAATWLRQARPGLDARQIGRALTASATDLGPPGRDPDYGEGILNIDAALTVTAPPADPMEPNDDIPWLNGSLIKKKAPYLWKRGKKGKKSRSVKATVSGTKDPSDVYRVKVPRRGKVLITVAQLQSDIKLEVFKPKTTSLLKPGKNLIVRSDRPRSKTEGVRVKNLKSKAQTIYVAITPSSRSVDEYYEYRLKVVGR